MSDPTEPDDSPEGQVRMLLQLLEEEQRRAASEDIGLELEMPEVDLRTLLSEMIALRAAVRAEASGAREVRDQLRESFKSLEKELANAEERARRLESDWTERLSIVGRRAVLDLIELSDRLEPAIEHARNLAKPWWAWLPGRRRSSAADALLRGLELTMQRLERQLREHGVRRIQTDGQRFDATTMEAVDRVERFGIDDGVVVQEVTAGYVRGNPNLTGRPADVSVVRIAQVVVNTNPFSGEA